MLNKRSEIAKEYKWNLDSLYITDEAWEVDFKLTEELFESIKKMKGSVLNSADSLYETINAYLSARIVITRLATYGKMKQDENTKDNVYQTLNSRAESLSVKFDEVSAYLIPELMQGEKETIENYDIYEILHLI